MKAREELGALDVVSKKWLSFAASIAGVDPARIVPVPGTQVMVIDLNMNQTGCVP